MAELPEVLPPDSDPSTDEGGGPIKSFLEHLEDLRWMLVRCAVALFLGIILCLSASNYIIDFLKWPLVQAQKIRTSSDPHVTIVVGTNILARFSANDPRQFPLAVGATNDTFFRLSTVRVGTNDILAVVPDSNPPEIAQQSMHVDLAVISPAEAFTVAIQIAIYGGITISSPFLLFFIAQFVLPALHHHEKKFIYRISGFSSGLFFAGVAFCYFVMMIVTLSATVGFSDWLGLKSSFWKASEYISFMCWFMIGMGLSFQLPLVLLTLVKIGLIDYRKLSSFRSYWVVAGLTLAAFVTPDGNPLTMFLMVLPLHVLYEISVFIAWRWDVKARRTAALEV